MSNNRYPIESLIREPVECYSALAGLLAASSLCILHNLLALTPLYASPVVLGLLVSAFCRLKQTRSISSYKKHLQQLVPYRLSLQKLPRVSNQLFIGNGFRWQAKHTARLIEADRALSQSLIQVDDQTGGTPFLNGVSFKQSPVFMANSDRVGHTLVLGTTRVGKTRLLEVLMTQDIRRGDAVFVFDPKGDLALLRRMVHEAKRAGREQDVVIFHLGFPESSARYNPIGQFTRITEVANRLTAQLPGQGESAAFKEFAWRFVNIIAKALVAMDKTPSYQLIKRYIVKMDQLLLDYCQHWLPTIGQKGIELLETLRTDLPSDKRAKFLLDSLEKAGLTNDVISGLESSISYEKTYFHKITASLLPLLDKLTTGEVSELLSPDECDNNDPRPQFSWREAIKQKKIIYVGLDALSDATVATAVGNSMFADLCSTAGQIYKVGFGDNTEPVPVCIHSDEFNELIGDEFIPLINKAGGAGFQVTAYTQTWADIEARLGSHAKAGQVAGNFNQLICLRVLDEATAKWVTGKLPERVAIKRLVPNSSVSDSPQLQSESHFNSQNGDGVQVFDRPLLQANDLLRLPKGQAFVLLQGGELYQCRLPLPIEDFDKTPTTVAAMQATCQEVEQ